MTLQDLESFGLRASTRGVGIEGKALAAHALAGIAMQKIYQNEMKKIQNKTYLK